MNNKQDVRPETPREGPSTTREQHGNSVKDMRKRKQRRRRVALVVGIAAVALIALLTAARLQRSAVASPASAASDATSYTVTTRSYRVEVDVSGNVEAARSESLFFRTSGEVRQVFVDVGDTVSPGELLAELRTDAKEYELAELDYQIEQARFGSSSRQLELLRKRRSLIVQDLERAELRTRIAGVVSERNVDPGSVVGTAAANAPLRIIDLSALKAHVDVDEYDINKVELGQAAELVFDALGSGIRVPGLVRSIPLEGRVTSQGIAVKSVEIVIPDPPDSVSPSYTFSGVIVAGDLQEILTLPRDFVEQQNDGTEMVRKRLPTGESVPVEVETAYHEAGMLRLLSGDLKQGDVIERRETSPRSGLFSIGTRRWR